MNLDLPTVIRRARVAVMRALLIDYLVRRASGDLIWR